MIIPHYLINIATLHCKVFRRHFLPARTNRTFYEKLLKPGNFHFQAAPDFGDFSRAANKELPSWQKESLNILATAQAAWNALKIAAATYRTGDERGEERIVGSKPHRARPARRSSAGFPAARVCRYRRSIPTAKGFAADSPAHLGSRRPRSGCVRARTCPAAANWREPGPRPSIQIHVGKADPAVLYVYLRRPL